MSIDRKDFSRQSYFLKNTFREDFWGNIKNIEIPRIIQQSGRTDFKVYMTMEGALCIYPEDFFSKYRYDVLIHITQENFPSNFEDFCDMFHKHAITHDFFFRKDTPVFRPVFTPVFKQEELEQDKKIKKQV